MLHKTGANYLHSQFSYRGAIYIQVPGLLSHPGHGCGTAKELIIEVFQVEKYSQAGPSWGMDRKFTENSERGII